MKTGPLLVGLCGVCAIVWMVVKWKTSNNRAIGQSAPVPYSDIRRQLLDSASELEDEPATPSRPAGLDTRLAEGDRVELSRLYPPCEENWKEYNEVLYRVIESIQMELRKIDRNHEWYELLSPSRRDLMVLNGLEVEVNNGGFDQYYLNSAGDGARFVAEALRRMGNATAADLVSRANATFPDGPARHRVARLRQLDALPDSARSSWNELDTEFFGLDCGCGGLVANLGGRIILDNPEEFFR